MLKDNLPLCGREKGAEALQRKTSNDTMRVATNRRQRSKEDSKMSELSLTHCKYECKYHVVFAPKFRRQVIYGKLKGEIGKVLRKLCEYKGIEILEANACPDHIHMLLVIPPKYSIAQVMGYLKGKSSLMIFDKFANLKYKYGNRHFWCKGYYVSMSPIFMDTINFALFNFYVASFIGDWKYGFFLLDYSVKMC